MSDPIYNPPFRQNAATPIPIEWYEDEQPRIFPSGDNPNQDALKAALPSPPPVGSPTVAAPQSFILYNDAAYQALREEYALSSICCGGCY